MTEYSDASFEGVGDESKHAIPIMPGLVPGIHAAPLLQTFQ
jgi:hypothetical protein